MHYLAANRRHILTPKHPASLFCFSSGVETSYSPLCVFMFSVLSCVIVVWGLHWLKYSNQKISYQHSYSCTNTSNKKNILDVFHALFKTYSHKPLPDRSGIFGNFLHLKDVSSTEDGERHFFFLIVSCWCSDFSLSEHCPPTVQPS